MKIIHIINAKVISRRGLNTSASTPDIHEASATINPYIAITLPACESLYPRSIIYLDKTLVQIYHLS